MTRKPRVLESAVQDSIIGALTLRGWLVVRMNSAQMPVGDSRWLRAYHVAGFGSAGFPDVLALKDGRAILIEVKTEKGKLTDRQRAFRDFAKRHGIEVNVCRSVADAVALAGGCSGVG